MPDANDHENEQHDGAILAEAVDQDVKDRVSVIRSQGGFKILDAEKQAEDQEPSEYSGATD